MNKFGLKNLSFYRVSDGGKIVIEPQEFEVKPDDSGDKVYTFKYPTLALTGEIEMPSRDVKITFTPKRRTDENTYTGLLSLDGGPEVEVEIDISELNNNTATFKTTN